MRILAVDVGFGTQDILLYEDSKILENCIKMVFPSMTQLLAKEVKKSTSDLCIHGITMGGGPLAHAIEQHLLKGYKVRMTLPAAKSIRDDLNQVKEMGVQIVEEHEPGKCRGKRLLTRDVDFPFLKDILHGLGESFTFDWIAVAVQDHGYAKDKSDREFRFEKFREALESDGKLSSLGFTSPPSYYSRMSSIVEEVKKYHTGGVFVADTKIAAIAGGLYGVKETPVIAIDVGNGHTTAAIVEKGNEVIGLFEHHTHMLSSRTLEDYLRRFAKGRLTNDEVYNEGGHGCYLRETPEEEPRRIIATGPRRHLLRGSSLKVSYASPMGDVMMTGPLGLVTMIRQLNNKPKL